VAGSLDGPAAGAVGRLLREPQRRRVAACVRPYRPPRQHSPRCCGYDRQDLLVPVRVDADHVIHLICKHPPDEREEVVGGGMAVPAWWDGEAASLPNGGLDAVVEARFAEGTPEPTALCALQILIAPECRGEGLSSRMIRRMAEIGRDHGLDTLIAPVRPTLKHLYPLTPMERYIGWRRADGTHFDPWLRTNERLGAETVKVAPQSTSARGSVAEWEEWVQMAFPETGAYVVPGALVPVEIDRERDEGLYLEPNVWMVHPGS
jgi:GNAT superfamily N-acetyltransferase